MFEQILLQLILTQQLLRIDGSGVDILKYMDPQGLPAAPGLRFDRRSYRVPSHRARSYHGVPVTFFAETVILS